MIEIHIKHEIFTSSGTQFLEINQQIEAGALVRVSGDSGIGKTTFFRIFSGLICPDFCVIKFNNSILTDTSKRFFLSPQKRNVSIMFQNYALFPNMTVRQNIAFSQKEKNAEAIDYFLEKLDLKKLEKLNITKLSGGQQQRVALARTLVQNADIVLLDEPFSAVEISMRKIMMQEIIKYKEARGSTFFIISHNEEDFENVFFKTLNIK